LVAGIIAIVLALVGGAGAFAAFRELSGGGTQPESVLPADSIAFAKIDFDPAAGQKVLALKFLNKLPKVGTSLAGGKDAKQAIFEGLASDSDLPKDFNYDRDVKPWLGDRLAVGVRPTASGTGFPDVVFAVQVKDEAKARAASRASLHRGRSRLALPFARITHSLLSARQLRIGQSRTQRQPICTISQLLPPT